MRKIFIILPILAVLLCACSKQPEKSVTNSNDASQKSSSSQEIKQDSQKTTQNTDSKAKSDPDWPSDLVGTLPKPGDKIEKMKKGTGEFANSTFIEISEMSMESRDKYIETLISQGFKSLSNMKAGDAINFVGMKDDRSEQVQVVYNTSTKQCSIIYTK